MEEFYDISGYEGLYKISKSGNVYSCKRNKILKWGSSGDYATVSLSKDNERKAYYVHRLVAQAFIPNPCGYDEVNHKDENPLNNCMDNLEWCTRKYNCNYGTHNEKISKALKGKSKEGHVAWNKGIKLSDEHKKNLSDSHIGQTAWNKQKVRCNELNMVFDSVTECAKKLGLYQQNISKVLTGKLKTTGGYHFEYALD